MSKSKRLEIIHEFINCYNNFDVRRMLSLLSDDIQFENISNGAITASANGRSEFEKLAWQSCNLFKERQQKIVGVFECEDQIEVKISYSAIFAKDLPNGIVAGQQLKLEGKSTFYFVGNKICKIIDES